MRKDGISDFMLWNADISSGFYFYPVDRRRLVEDCESDFFASWIHRTYHARLVIEESFIPMALFRALKRGYDATQPENIAIAESDGFDWPVTPEWDYYGENFYTLDGFAAVVEDFAAASGEDVYCQKVAEALGEVLRCARVLDGTSHAPGFGVMVTGP